MKKDKLNGGNFLKEGTLSIAILIEEREHPLNGDCMAEWVNITFLRDCRKIRKSSAWAESEMELQSTPEYIAIFKPGHTM